MEIARRIMLRSQLTESQMVNFGSLWHDPRAEHLPNQKKSRSISLFYSLIQTFGGSAKNHPALTTIDCAEHCRGQAGAARIADQAPAEPVHDVADCHAAFDIGTSVGAAQA